MRNPFLWMSLLSLGCSSAVLPISNDAAVTTDGSTSLDASTNDAPPPDDTTTGPDALPPLDVPAGPDAQPPVDVFGPPPDVFGVPDNGPPVDAGTAPSLLGRWRAVAVTVRSITGETVRLTDVDQPVVTDPMTGATSPFRVNGYLTLDETRVSTALGLLSTGFFYASSDRGRDTYSATGTTVPGLYDRATQTFTVSGGASVLRLVALSTNRISYTEPEGGTVTEYARAADLGGSLTAINSVVGAQLRHPMSAGPFARARAALLWGAPASATRVESHGYALSFMSGYASMPLALGSTPEASAIHTVDGVRAAVAYPIVYDDVDGDGRFDPSNDALRGVSPVVIVWTAPGASLAGTRFRDAQAGYVYAHAHTDYTRGADGFAPFDLTRPVQLNIPVEDGRTSGVVPNALR